MGELKKGGIRAAMSENTERETLKRMGRRGDETVSHDTQVKQEAPERLTKQVCPDGFIDCRAHPAPSLRTVEYIRADLLATVRREVFKEAVKLVQTMSLIEARHCSIEFINGAQWALDRAAQSIIAALEASTTEKEKMK